MNGRNKGKSICSTLCYGKESVFKRSLVSPLCSYIVPRFFRNARRKIVQNSRFLFLQYAETVILHNPIIDILFQLWYTGYVGAVIGTACYFAYLNAVSTGFVNFHMETIRNPEIIG